MGLYHKQLQILKDQLQHEMGIHRIHSGNHLLIIGLFHLLNIADHNRFVVKLKFNNATLVIKSKRSYAN